MMCNWGRVLWAEESGYAFIWQQAVTLGRMPVDAVPDLGDPATLGCLLHLVQQAGGGLPVHVDAESLVMALEACDD